MSRTYETAIKIGAFISKAFKAETYGAAAAVTKLTGATKQLKAAETAAKSVKKLDDALKRSKASYNAASEALQRLKDAEIAAGGATKESTQWRKAGERQLAKYAREVDRATKASEKNAEAARKLPQLKVQASFERLFGERNASKVPLVSKARDQVRGLASDAFLLGTAATGAAAAIGGLVIKTLKTGDEVGDTADKLGIAAQALQELRYGARQSGGEVEDLDRAIAKMAVNIGKHKIVKGKGGAGGPFAIPGLQSLATGGGEAAPAAIDPFKQIGLSAKELSKLKPDEQFKKVADGLSKLKTHAERAAIAQEIFGKGATEILPFLAEGSAGIEKLSKDAHKYGGVLSDEAIKNADLADKAMRDAEMAVAGLTATLGAELLPTVTNVFKTFSGWVASNRGQIKQWAENAAKWIETKGIPAFKHLVDEVQNVGGKVLWLVNGAAKLTGGFGNLALAAAGLRLAPMALTFGKIGVEATKAAVAVFQYVTAKKAAAAAGGMPGFDAGAAASTGKAIGLAANASMLAGAASIGFAIGSYLDEKFQISDSIEKGIHILTTDAQDLNEGDRAAKKSAWSIFKAGLFGGTGGLVEASVKAHRKFVAEKTQQLASAPPRTGGGGGAHVAPVINIHDARTREDVRRGMEHATDKALEAYDRREAKRKRVSFGH